MPEIQGDAAQTPQDDPSAFEATHYGPRPSQGRIVLYTDESGLQIPAIIVRVHSPNVINLAAFNDVSSPDGGAVAFFYSVPFHPRGRNFSWCWPPRV